MWREIAARAGVSKPVLYEHFGGKGGLYAVVVDREMLRLEGIITAALENGRSRFRIEQAVLALLTYVEEHTDGFLDSGSRCLAEVGNTVIPPC